MDELFRGKLSDTDVISGVPEFGDFDLREDEESVLSREEKLLREMHINSRKRSCLGALTVVLVCPFLFTFLADGGEPQILQFHCQFVPHQGGASNEPDLGYINILSDSGYHDSLITSGSIDAEFSEGTSLLSQLVIESESVMIRESATGPLRISLNTPAPGSYDPDLGHLSIQIDLDLIFELVEREEESQVPAIFRGQLEVAPEGKALAGQIRLTENQEIAPFGEVQFLVARVFCVYE